MSCYLTQKRSSSGVNQKSSGYTIISILIATVIFGILGLVTYGYLRQTNDAKVTSAEQILTTNYPRAIISYINVAGYPQSSTSADITTALERRGLKNTTVWGKAWTASTTGSGQTANVTVTYPVGTGTSDTSNNGVADTVSATATEMATALSDGQRYPEIKSATANGSSLTIVYRLQ